MNSRAAERYACPLPVMRDVLLLRLSRHPHVLLTNCVASLAEVLSVLFKIGLNVWLLASMERIVLVPHHLEGHVHALGGPKLKRRMWVEDSRAVKQTLHDEGQPIVLLNHLIKLAVHVVIVNVIGSEAPITLGTVVTVLVLDIPKNPVEATLFFVQDLPLGRALLAMIFGGGIRIRFLVFL